MGSNLIEDSNLALEKLSHLEMQLVKETEELFKRQVDHIKNIDQLQTLRPNMSKINIDIKKLSSLVDSSSSLVEEVCSKFRSIDQAKLRLQECLSKISDVHDLRACRNGINKAIQNRNYEEAAMHIKRFLSIDQDELKRTISIICCQQSTDKRPSLNQIAMVNVDDEGKEYLIELASVNSTIKELTDARQKLLTICHDNIDKAIVEDDQKEVDRFFKIFPLLNEYQGGLIKYSNYVNRKIVTPQLDETLRSSQLNQADKLAALYERIAKLIDSHQPLVETYYGPGYLINLVRLILKESDRLSRKILEEFRNVRKLQLITREIQKATNPKLITQNTMSSNRATPVGPQLPAGLDPRNIDSILNEMALIISRSEVFLNFLVNRMKEDLKIKSEGEVQERSSCIEIYQLISMGCELNYLIQEVGSIHVLLERFYLEESSKIAIQMDKVDTQTLNYFISSMLDDIFFLIKKCTKRAISTRSNEVFCAIINHCFYFLDSTFCEYLEDKIRNQQYYANPFMGKNVDNSHYFSSLNNLDRACDYIQTLKGILKQDLNRLKSSQLSLLRSEQNQDVQMEKSLTCLSELSKLIGKFNSIVNSSLYQLFNTVLRNRLRTDFKTILNENPDLLVELGNSDELCRLARDLLNNFDKSLQTNLSPENYSRLVVITKDCLEVYCKNPK